MANLIDRFAASVSAFRNPLQSNTKGAVAPTRLPSLEDEGPWRTVYEAAPGDFQRDVKFGRAPVESFVTVFSCVSILSADGGKLGISLKRRNGKIWTRVDRDPLINLIERPNIHQHRILFVENWIQSLLLRGNAYILKMKDDDGNVIGLNVLDPDRVRVKVKSNGEAVYALEGDNISGMTQSVDAPASMIIHDRINTFYHPLVGMSPLQAAYLPAMMGLEIQHTSRSFFANRAEPNGYLKADSEVTEEDAKKLKAMWRANYGGANRGKIAVLQNGMEYKQITVTAEDAQLIEQLKLTSEMVAKALHVPAYMVVPGVEPKYDNAAAHEQFYYSRALQTILERIEASLRIGLDLPNDMKFEFDQDDLIRMDPVARMSALKEGIQGIILSPNEARERLDLPPVPGGNYPLAQQQYFALDPQAPAAAPRSKPANDDASVSVARRGVKAFRAALRG